MLNSQSTWGLRFTVAIAAMGAALGACWLLGPMLDPFCPLVVVAAVAIAVWAGGYAPASLVALAGYLVFDWFFVEPTGRSHLSSGKDFVVLAVYAITCGIIIAMGESLRRGKRRAKQDREALAAERRRADEESRQIVELRSAGDALRESEERERVRLAELQTIMEAVPAVIWIARDPDCRVIVGNSASYELLRLPSRVNASMSAPEGERPSHFQVLADGKVLRTEELPVQRAARGQEVRNLEEEVRFDDGTSRYLLGNATPLRDGQGNPRGAVAAFVDITERKHLEKQLRERLDELAAADRRKDEFLATLSHELRNPVAPIRNAVQVLQLAAGDEEESKWGRDLIERQVRVLARLLDDLLDVSRITRGKLELRREHVTLASVVNNAVETSEPLIDAAGVTLHLAPLPGPVCIDADPIRLAQMLSNLLNNSAKYTDRGGNIWLTVQASGSDVTLTVKDDGIGILPEMLPRVFEIFSQAVPAVERAQGGLGIGLSLVRGIAELHGGTIDAHSDGLGRGSAFTARLPIVMPGVPADPPKEPDIRPRAATPARRRVLVAEDNVESAESLVRLLRLKGHDVQAAHDGRAAVEEAARFRPEVALLDIGLPELSGYDVARHLRQQSWGKQMTLVALTGWGQDEDKRMAAEAGFDEHFVKPIDPALLFELLSLAPAGPEEQSTIEP